MNRMRDIRGGKRYDSTFGKRLRGEGPYADLISQRFKHQCRRLGLNRVEEPPLRTDLFRRPSGEQLGLFG